MIQLKYLHQHCLYHLLKTLLLLIIKVQFLCKGK